MTQPEQNHADSPQESSYTPMRIAELHIENKVFYNVLLGQSPYVADSDYEADTALVMLGNVFPLSASNPAWQRHPELLALLPNPAAHSEAQRIELAFHRDVTAMLLHLDQPDPLDLGPPTELHDWNTELLPEGYRIKPSETALAFYTALEDAIKTAERQRAAQQSASPVKASDLKVEVQPRRSTINTIEEPVPVAQDSLPAGQSSVIADGSFASLSTGSSKESSAPAASLQAKPKRGLLTSFFGTTRDKQA